MTYLRKLTFFLILLIILVIILFFKNFFIFSGITFILIIMLSIIWYRLIVEELAIYFIMKEQGQIEEDKLKQSLGGGGKANSAIVRLLNKGMIKKNDNVVYLLIEDYKFTMSKYLNK